MRRVTLALVLAAGMLGGCLSTSTSTTNTTTDASAVENWPVLTRRHIDLWLHGYAMLLRDTSTITIFRPGYRASIEAIKSQQGVSTDLDANRAQLQQRLLTNPGLANGQFVALYFGSWDDMVRVIRQFLQAQGNVGATNDPTTQQYFSLLAASYPSGGDRNWLRLFVNSLEDERSKFYEGYWLSQNRAHLPLVRAADSLWQATYRNKFGAFLNNTAQQGGRMYLALTLGGEGRTVNFGARQNGIAVTMPERDPLEAVYVFAHESVSSMVNTAVTDNTTPAEQRNGVSAAYVAKGAVRGGAMLLHRIAPELEDSYMKYYLALANEQTGGDFRSRFTSVFSLPDVVRGAIDRQLEVVLGGL